MLDVAPWWGMKVLVPTLDARTMNADRLDAVRKNEIFRGDSVLVRTKNSVYAIRALGNGFYRVSGGWFDRNGSAGQVVTINGCTWGGSAIKQDIVAARGLFLEFGNRVVTTRIRDILVLRANEGAQRHQSGSSSFRASTTLPLPKNYLN